MSGDDPFADIEKLFDQLTRFEPGSGGDVAVDVLDEDDAFVVRADLPGYEPDDIDVQLEDDHRVTVSAMRETEETTEEGDYVRRERHTEQVERTVKLPAPVDGQSAEASYENGVLTVRLGKETADEGTDIPVN